VEAVVGGAAEPLDQQMQTVVVEIQEARLFKQKMR
jgi:hypothetical protein